MKHLRWLLVPCILAILAVIAFIGYLMWQRIDMVDYESRLVQSFGTAGENGVVAQMDGVNTVVAGDNREKLRSFLTVSDKQKVKHTPDPDAQTMTIRVGTSMTIIVEKGDEAADETFFTVQSGAWKRTFRTEGLKSFYWITRTAGAEGYYYPNAVIVPYMGERQGVIPRLSLFYRI
ncbi:MAG: hypothetical protein VB111_05300 [Clostridiaceae bacterium]|nr:hypothetical protein [Clostridiaceae bacterium]